MSILVSLCLLKIEIVREMNDEGKRIAESLNQFFVFIISKFLFSDEEASAGAVSSEHPTNPRLVKDLRGQRKPKKIQIETYANALVTEDSESSDKGVLPKSSREQTPLDDIQPIPDVPGELNFFSGNPFVEQTTGILHLFKKK